ncbi:MAG: hypothetical protein PHE86_03185 [Candidatus Marinimicrobia bacterium]|nr:hypothetical protein [Candidatus Neomarinimicrobiota bacterium]
MKYVFKKHYYCLFVLLLVLLFAVPDLNAQKNYTGPPMFINVNAINLTMKKVNGEGQFTNQYSWMLTGDAREQTEEWYYPADRWHSQMLYQIFNPACPDDNGFIDQEKKRKIIPDKCVNQGKNDYSWERRRYRTPYITVDGVRQNQDYTGEVDPTLKADIVAEWEDVLRAYGIRSKVQIYAFSNQNHQDYIIYKATYKFTGETMRPLENPDTSDFFPSQTMRLWWPISFSFGPTKAGEYMAHSYFAYEGEDDLDSWFATPVTLASNAPRDSLKIAYYWDYKTPGGRVYPNGSSDDTGDPDRQTGHLHSPQIPGYALLYSSKNTFYLTSDDISQPYDIPHADIVNDLWSRADVGVRDTYIGNDNRGRFPLDPITEGFITASGKQKGPMRFITIGPYELTLDHEHGIHDSICAVYAIGVGSISWDVADSIGMAWFEGKITDAEKEAAILTGKDSLAKVMDRAYWAYTNGLNVPDPPPPPDIEVTSDADRIIVEWSYPDESYFKDPDTGVDDWYAWRVYRKRGEATVGAPTELISKDQWELIHETTNRYETQYIDNEVIRGVSYFYAVTAIDDGSQNTFGLYPGQKLESPYFANRSQIPARPFQAGLATTKEVRVVPNPYSINAGILNFPGGSNQLMFARLPYKCTLTVYTENGDEVTRFDHVGTDQVIWDQRTNTNQYISTGIYILAVCDAEDVEGNKLDNQYVKFVVIR